MKRILLILTIAVSLNTAAQQNCNLINSATLNVDTTTLLFQQTSMHYLLDTAIVSPISLKPIIDTNVWHYIVYTKAASRVGKIYIDGVLAASGEFINHSYNYSQLYLAASFYTSWGGYFKGWLDEFRMSNIVRTDTEILDHYQSNQPFITDANTIGLWHFDENSGTSFANAVTGNGTLYNGASFTTGKFSNAVYFDGVDDRGDCNLNIPENDITLEFWVKLDGSQTSCVIQPYGLYSSDITVSSVSETPSYTWSTGDTTGPITINPQIDSMVWVTDGNCTDTMFFNQNYVTIYDSVSVMDTLIIDVMLTGITAPNNTNTIKVYPNPTNDQITIDNGNFSSMNGYDLEIKNSLGQSVFQSAVNQQQFTLSLNSWGGNGLYFLYITDPNTNIIEIKKIVLQ